MLTGTKLKELLDSQSDFDGLFKEAHAKFFDVPAAFTWQLFKAQAWVESSLRPGAQSPLGAMGLMQIMPATWQEIAAQIGVSDPWDPRQNVHAGVFYMRQLWDCWDRFKDNEDQRIKFALASYNAGRGNIARMLSRNPPRFKAQQDRIRPDWETASAHLASLTGPTNAAQTRRYVRRILKIYALLVADLPEVASPV